MKKIKLSLVLLCSTMLLQAEELEKVVITPNKRLQPLQNVTTSVDVITADEIQERGYRVLSDALSTHPGFSFARNGGLGQTTSVFLRGFDSKRVLVLIDGVRYNDPTSLSGAQFEHILLGNVDRVEIVKNPQSGIWGSDASAGVINIITKRAQKDGVSASIHAEYGSYNTQNYGFDTAVKSGKFDLSLGLERLSSDGFSAKTANNQKAKDFEDDSYSNNSYSTKLGYQLTGNDRVETFFNYIDADADYDGYITDPTTFKYDALKSANDKISNNKSKEKFYGIRYIRNTQDYSTKLYYQRSDFSRDNKSAFSANSFDGSIDESGLVLNYKLNTDSIISGGFDYKKFKHKNEIDKDFTNKGFYISASSVVHEDIGDSIISATVRRDNFDNFDDKTTYRVGFKHTPASNKELTLFANYATGYNAPTLYQLYAKSSYPGFADPGNPNLKPETTKGYELGFNYGGFNLTYFNNKIEDMIDYTTHYDNLAGKTKLKGIEVAYNGSIKEASLAYSLNYTYLKTKDAKGKELARRPKSSANLSLDYYALPNTHLGALVSYVGKRKKSQYDANPTDDYKSYTLVDLTAGYDFSEALNIYAKIENALDKEYENIAGYGVSERAYYVGFRYKLK